MRRCRSPLTVLSVLSSVLICSHAQAQYGAPSTSNLQAPAATSVTEAPPTHSVLIFGTGDVQAPQAEVQKASAAGGVGIGYEGPIFHLTIGVRKGTLETVGAATNADGTVNAGQARDYGRTILDPAALNFNFNGDLGAYILELSEDGLRPRLGLYGYLSAGGVNWAYAVPPANAMAAPTISTIEAEVFGTGLCASVMGRKRAGANVIGLWGHVCWARRSISGDVGESAALNARIAMIGTAKTTFDGVEAIVGGRVGNLSLGARLLWFPGDSSVDGLSGTRFIPFVSATAPIEIPVD